MHVEYNINVIFNSCAVNVLKKKFNKRVNYDFFFVCTFTVKVCAVN